MLKEENRVGPNTEQRGQRRNIMARRRRAEKRDILPDPVYNSNLIAKFINKVMLNGKKGTSERIMYDAMKTLAEKTGKNGLEVVEKAIENVKPRVEVKSRRIGGATYQVPVEIRPERKTSLALRWIINFSRQNSGRPLSERLAKELLDAYNGTGSSIKKKEDTHKMAEANKAFAHFRW